MLSRILVAALALSAVSFPALAQDGADARFQLERRGDNIIRLDRRTGTISTCTERNGSLDCRASADERAALQDEIDRLAAEVDRLKGGDGNSANSDGKSVTLKLPSEQEINGALDFLREWGQRAVDAVRALINGNA
jgi:hypothetical protein